MPTVPYRDFREGRIGGGYALARTPQDHIDQSFRTMAFASMRHSGNVEDNRSGVMSFLSQTLPQGEYSGTALAKQLGEGDIPGPPAKGRMADPNRSNYFQSRPPGKLASEYDTQIAALPTGGDDPRGMIPHIRETAVKYGIDPNVAVRVARSEGLRGFKSGIPGEDSWGAFQLFTGGGLGNVFQDKTGLNPRDPKNEKATIDFALRTAAQVGWSPWHGAKNTGIGEWEGIRRGK